MRILVVILLLIGIDTYAQTMGVKEHPNNRRMAITQNDTIILSDYVYSEVSEWSENKAYVAKGDLYGYIDTSLKELSPFVFAEANNFKRTSKGHREIYLTDARKVAPEKYKTVLRVKVEKK